MWRSVWSRVLPLTGHSALGFLTRARVHSVSLLPPSHTVYHTLWGKFTLSGLGIIFMEFCTTETEQWGLYITNSMRGEQRSELDKIYDRNKLETVRQTSQTRQQEDNLYRITSLTLALRSSNSNNILQEPPGPGKHHTSVFRPF